MEMDWIKVAALLEVVHKSATAGPAYTWFGDMAYAELRKLKEEALNMNKLNEPAQATSFSGFKIPGDEK